MGICVVLLSSLLPMNIPRLGKLLVILIAVKDLHCCLSRQDSSLRSE
jgi:hypothetical protein